MTVVQPLCNGFLYLVRMRKMYRVNDRVSKKKSEDWVYLDKYCVSVSNTGKISIEGHLIDTYYNSQNYEVLRCPNGKRIYVHQLVAIAFLGHEPNGMKNVVDHINGDVKDNRVENLRIVSIRENANNRHHNKSSQFVGVNWHKRSKKWQSKIKYQGKQYTLGMFTDEKEAALAYQSAKTILEKIAS